MIIRVQNNQWQAPVSLWGLSELIRSADFQSASIFIFPHYGWEAVGLGTSWEGLLTLEGDFLLLKGAGM